MDHNTCYNAISVSPWAAFFKYSAMNEGILKQNDNKDEKEAKRMTQS